MAPTTPYTKALAGREPLDTLRATTEQIRALTAAWTPSQFGRTYAAGKWTAQQILMHLAQTELGLGTRARMALTTPDYVAQPFDQDSWLAQEHGLSGREAADTFVTLSHMNLTLYSALSESDRQKALSHPEYGSLTVDWIIYMMAGHQAHHLAQLDLISRL